MSHEVEGKVRSKTNID